MTNIVLNPGALGATLGTDTVAGVDYQIVKLGYSVSGAAPTQVSTANPLPVVQTGALPAGANVIGAVTQSGGPWSGNVTQLGGNAVNLGTGNTGTGTQRIVIATDQPTLTNAQPVLQSGTWTVNQGGTWSVRNQDGTGNALTSATRGAQQALSVQIIDGSGNQITSFGGSGGTASNYGSAFPASGTAGGYSDGTNMQGARVYDTDSGAGTQYTLGVSLRKTASGGSVEAGTSSDPLRVDPTGSTTQPVSGTVTANAGSGTFGVNLTQAAGTALDVNSGNKSAGTIRVVLATDQPSLANALPVTQSGTWTVQPGNTANTTPWLVTDTPATSGGLSFVAVPVSAATNNKTQVKGAAGQLYTISAQNLNAAPRYLKVFNNTSAGVTMGATACDFQFLIPGNTAGAGLLINIDKGITMGTGITIAITGGIATTDNTAIAANEVTALIGYK